MTKRGTLMTYKTIVTDYAPKAKKMADEIEKVINEKAKDGWEPVSFSVTNSCNSTDILPPGDVAVSAFALYSKHLQYRRQSK